MANNNQIYKSYEYEIIDSETIKIKFNETFNINGFTHKINELVFPIEIIEELEKRDIVVKDDKNNQIIVKDFNKFIDLFFKE